MASLPPGRRVNELDDLEKLIASAQYFVIPSERLRPAIVDIGRELDLRQLQWRKLRSLVACVLLTWALVVVVFFYLRANQDRWTRPSSAEMEERSLDYAARYRYGKDWGTADAFQELRSGPLQANSSMQAR